MQRTLKFNNKKTHNLIKMENEINRYRTKEDMRMVNKCIKNAQHYMSQENHKVKQKIRYHDTSHREAEIHHCNSSFTLQ